MMQMGINLPAPDLKRGRTESLVTRRPGTKRAVMFIFYFDGIRLSKMEISTEKADGKKRFFYSKWDTPDSIELYAETLIPLLIHREYYLINGHGDPIRHLSVAGIDTMQVEL